MSFEKGNSIEVDKSDNASLIKNSDAEESFARMDIERARALSAPNSYPYLERAKKHLYTALMLEPEKGALHYGLFKVAVLEEEYREAFYQLQLYDKKSAPASHNFLLTYRLLNALLDKREPVPKGNPEYIQDREIVYEPIRLNYQFALDAFQQREYQKVLKHLQVCQTLASTKEIDADFSDAILLAERVYQKYKARKKKALKVLFLEEQHVGNRMMISQSILKLDDQDVEGYFMFMDTYLDLKVYSTLEDILMKVRVLPMSAQQKQMVSFYERIVKEKQIENTFFNEINHLLKKIQGEEKEKNYTNALALYDYGYQTYGWPHFCLKKAELCYWLGDNETAKALVQTYLQEGYVSYQDAVKLLYKIYLRMDSSGMAIMTALEGYSQTRLKERGISLNDWMEQLQKEYQQDEMCFKNKSEPFEEESASSGGKAYIYQSGATSQE